jgi:signal transduction histidine kinase
LNTQYDSFDDLKRKDLIQKMNTSSLYAYDLLDNLLSWARTQTDGIIINKEQLNLKKLVETSISSYLLDAESKNISVINNVQAELLISIDENTALTFIRNIVSNAIKFTRSGGSITIDSHLNEEGVRLHITDTGVGMPPEVLDNLFQIDKDISTSGTNNEKGTGLGLILCKEFIERNGGSISVKSEVDKGSEFIIALPL